MSDKPELVCTCGRGTVFHAPFHDPSCPCFTHGSMPPKTRQELRIEELEAALAQAQQRIKTLEDEAQGRQEKRMSNGKDANYWQMSFEEERNLHMETKQQLATAQQRIGTLTCGGKLRRKEGRNVHDFWDMVAIVWVLIITGAAVLGGIYLIVMYMPSWQSMVATGLFLFTLWAFSRLN